MPRWSLDDLLAVLWGAAGLGITGYFVAIGVGTRAMGSNPLPILGLAAVVLVVCAVVAGRHARRAAEARAERAEEQRRSRPDDDRRSGPEGDPPRRERPDEAAPRARAREDAVRSSGRDTAPDPPTLSAEGRAALARVVGIADRAGLFAPRTPRPVDLMESVGDAVSTGARREAPVTLDLVLAAVQEADHWHPELDPDDHLAALAFHDAQTEQLDGTLRAQAHDLARLTGAEIVVEELEVAQGRTRARVVVVGNSLDLAWASRPKALSTVLHVAVARALHAAGAPRLAWTWSDQGVWLAALTATTPDDLNRELGRALVDRWRWVDEDRPTAAGDVRRRR